jgi:RNA recognition motif-containing protein
VNQIIQPLSTDNNDRFHQRIASQYGDIVTSSSPLKNSFVEMKVSKGKSKHSKGNSLHTMNQHRKRIAGKPGNKHFLDPNKVFIGNLSYDTTDEDMKQFLSQHLGGLHSVESVKIIRDWKTNKSKGFGFIEFYDPMFATSAMQSIKNKKLKGRVIRLDQGRKKDDLDNRVLFVKKRERVQNEDNVDEEDKVINEALDEVDDDEVLEDGEYSVNDFDDNEDSLLFPDEDGQDDDDDDDLDGWFEDVYGSNKWEPLDEEEAKDMNREQRREAQRAKPRRKLPKKGFE